MAELVDRALHPIFDDIKAAPANRDSEVELPGLHPVQERTPLLGGERD
jgi:hypothetical protein